MLPCRISGIFSGLLISHTFIITGKFPMYNQVLTCPWLSALEAINLLLLLLDRTQFKSAGRNLKRLSFSWAWFDPFATFYPPHSHSNMAHIVHIVVRLNLPRASKLISSDTHTHVKAQPELGIIVGITMLEKSARLKCSSPRKKSATLCHQLTDCPRAFYEVKLAAGLGRFGWANQPR